MAGAGYPTWPDTFLPGIENRIVQEVKTMTRDRVFASMWSEQDLVDWAPADRFVALFNNEFPVDVPGVSGGGRLTTNFESNLVVTCFVRLEVDPELRNTRLMQDEVFGVYQLVRGVLNALQTWVGPQDTTTELYLFRRPMRVRNWRVTPRRGKSNTRWAVCPSAWEVSFVSNVQGNFLDPLNW